MKQPGLSSTVFAILLAAASFFTAEVCSATTGIINVWGTVKLTENHHGSVILNGDNARLDCDGHTIYDSTQAAFCGENGDESCGIYAVGLVYPYVINCTVRNFDIGMYMWGNSYPTVRNSTFRGNSDGMLIMDTLGSSGTFLLNNYFRNNTDEGLSLRGTSSLRVILNKFRYNESDGVDINECGSLVFDRNDHRENLGNGLEFDDSSSATVTSSTFISNGIGTNRNGLSLDNTVNATVTGNTFTSNERSGFRVASDSDGGTFSSNTGSGNGSEDAYQSSNSSNTWSGNSWGSTSPSGLK